MGTDTCIMKLLASLLIAGLATAQDTTYCNDGWELYTVEWQGQAHHSCFWFGTNYEKVTHDSAKLICESMGGFMAEVPYGPHLNNWLVNKLIEKNTKNNNMPDLRSTGEGGLGAPVSPTTIADRTVSPTCSTETSSLVDTAPSIGTTGTAMSLKTSSAKLSSTRLYTVIIDWIISQLICLQNHPRYEITVSYTDLTILC